MITCDSGQFPGDLGNLWLPVGGWEDRWREAWEAHETCQTTCLTTCQMLDADVGCDGMGCDGMLSATKSDAAQDPLGHGRHGADGVTDVDVSPTCQGVVTWSLHGRYMVVLPIQMHPNAS